MNSKTTGVWFVVAAALAGVIFIFQHWLRPAVVEPAAVLSGLRPDSVRSLQVIPPDALEIRADRTNGVWLLTRPVVYPAQATAVDALLDALQKLTADARISPGELRSRPDADTEFGFENPTDLVIETGSQRWELHIGHRTAPGNQVYLRVIGIESTFVADADWLKLVPHSANDWRDTALVDANPAGFNWIVLTNNTKGLAIELRRDPTNHLWRMIRPLQARADSGHLTDALQHLLAAHVAQFVGSAAKTDPAAFGLQPADLDLWLGNGANAAAALHIGKSLTNDPTQVFARREGWNAIFATAKGPLAAWYGSVNAFRDTNLLELTAPVAEIEARGPDTNRFVLQRHGSNDWSIVGEKYSADAASVRQFLATLAGLRIVDFVRGVATARDLPAYGLDKPRQEVVLRSKAGDTNAVIADLLFGAVQTNEVFVRRTDEDSIYAIKAEDYNLLFGNSGLFSTPWQFRDRRIWNFDVGDVARVTLRQDGKMRELVHDGPDKWSLGPGSQGVIDGQSIERAVRQISSLTAVGWLACGISDAEAAEKFGFSAANLKISLTLKDGRKFAVGFGLPISDGSALAAVTLDGERWVFLFPTSSYLFVTTYLTIPANVP